MAIFANLPVELLPLIFNFVVKTHHLTQCCLVNKTFASFVVPRLYEKIYIYAWHKEGKNRARNLFRTLAEHPELGKWVRKLELRDFPKFFDVAERQALSQLCVAGLLNCPGLCACTWTRDQTITSEILDALKQCPSLKELEINGHSATYSPISLLDFHSLTKISLIMPSANVIAVLPTWLANNSQNLTSLQIICKSSGLVTDQILVTIAQSVSNLKHLHLLGCVKVTHIGIGALLQSNQAGFESLGLEGLSSTFSLDCLSQYSKSLNRLESITLTLPYAPISPTWTTEFLAFTEHSPLTRIHIYYAAGAGDSLYHKVHWFGFSVRDFVESVLLHHGSRLHTLSVNRMNLDTLTVNMISLQCTQLKNLFIVVDPSELDYIIPALAKSKSLRNIHVSFPQVSNIGRLSQDKVLQIARSLGPQIHQIGFANRVYQIERVARLNESGKVVVDVMLGPYEQPEVPEQFLVVRL